jgi:hypothetical protein
VPTLLAVMLFLSGFLIRVAQIPVYWRWITRVNMLHYSWAGLMVNQFEGHPEATLGGNNILQYYDLEGRDKWVPACPALAQHVPSVLVLPAMLAHRLGQAAASHLWRPSARGCALRVVPLLAAALVEPRAEVAAQQLRLPGARRSAPPTPGGPLTRAARAQHPSDPPPPAPQVGPGGHHCGVLLRLVCAGLGRAGAHEAPAQVTSGRGGLSGAHGRLLLLPPVREPGLGESCC